MVKKKKVTPEVELLEKLTDLKPSIHDRIFTLIFYLNSQLMHLQQNDKDSLKKHIQMLDAILKNYRQIIELTKKHENENSN